MGGVAASISKTAAAPIERVKLLIQNQGEMLKSGRLAKPYSGITECFVRTYQEEGLASFWRGNNANVIRYFPTQALNFAFKDKIKLAFATPKNAPYWKQFASNIGAGGAAGAATSVFVYSLDYARTRLTTDAKMASGAGERQFNGLLDVYRKTLRADGILGLYRGFIPNLAGIIAYRGLFFGLYDSLKPILLHGSLQDNFFASFALAWGTSTTASLASYPFDTIRRRMMMTSGSGVHYKNFVDCGKQIVLKEGTKSLFRGAGANVIRSVAGGE